MPMKITSEDDNKAEQQTHNNTTDIALLCCPCGAKANDVDWTGSSNRGGKTYQTCWVTCTSCDTDVSITVNTEIENNSVLYEQMLCDTWNKLTRAS